MHSETFSRTQTYRGRKMPPLRRLLHFLRALVLTPILIYEFPSLLGVKSSRSRFALMFLNDLSNSTHGAGLTLMNKIISVLRLPRTREFDKQFLSVNKMKNLNNIDISEEYFIKIVQEIKLNGFAKVPSFVSQEFVDEAMQSILSSGGFAKVSKTSYELLADWLESTDGGPRFESDTSKLNTTNFTLAFKDNAFVNRVARKVLNSAPICDSVQSWTTRPSKHLDSNSKDEAAMAFHADADYFGFIKFFVLLTKVEMNNGPFAFVKGSHRKQRHVAGRMSDSEILGPDDVVLYGTGSPGDIVIACTSGWHKATPPIEGTRTMVQFLFTSSLFGQAT